MSSDLDQNLPTPQEDPDKSVKVLGIDPNKLLTKLCQKMETSLDCWLWTGSRNSKGYGSININGFVFTVHRIAWEVLVGPLRHNERLDHLCLMKHCFNPDCLEPVDDLTNNRRNQGWYQSDDGTWYCPQYHPIIGHNAMTYQKNKVTCRICFNDKRRANYVRKSLRH